MEAGHQPGHGVFKHRPRPTALLYTSSALRQTDRAMASTGTPAPTRPDAPVVAGGGDRRVSAAARRVLRVVTGRETVSPELYGRVAFAALSALTLIVLTGAAVRLTDSGLGCPDWPRCYGQAVAPLKSHAIIEYSNRLISGLVGLVAIAAGALAFRRRPFRRDLGVIGVLLPVGVVAQAILGGVTVEQRLAPGYVMAHFGLSMMILVAAVTLAWRATHEPGSRERSGDRSLVWSTTALTALGAVTIFAGTVATAAGAPRRGQQGPGHSPAALARRRNPGLGDPPARRHRGRLRARCPGLLVAGAPPGASRVGGAASPDRPRRPARHPGAHRRGAVRTAPSVGDRLGPCHPRCPHLGCPAVGGGERRSTARARGAPAGGGARRSRRLAVGAPAGLGTPAGA